MERSTAIKIAFYSSMAVAAVATVYLFYLIFTSFGGYIEIPFTLYVIFAVSIGIAMIANFFNTQMELEEALGRSRLRKDM